MKHRLEFHDENPTRVLVVNTLDEAHLLLESFRAGRTFRSDVVEAGIIFSLVGDSATWVSLRQVNEDYAEPSLTPPDYPIVFSDEGYFVKGTSGKLYYAGATQVAAARLQEYFKQRWLENREQG